MIQNLFSVRDKKILITGASSGLGKNFALKLSQEGAHVILVARREELLIKVQEEIINNNGKCDILKYDLNSISSIKSLAKIIFERFKYIDVLINNAGYSPKIKKDIFEIDEEYWDNILNINLKSLFFLTKEIARNMKENNIAGSIINISSFVANRTRKGNPIYAIAKTGVASLTQKLAIEFSQFNIRVNAIAPGFFKTDMNKDFLESEKGLEIINKSVPLKKVGDESDLDGIIFYLASKASNYVTGECFYIDGGCVANEFL